MNSYGRIATTTNTELILIQTSKCKVIDRAILICFVCWVTKRNVIIYCSAIKDEIVLSVMECQWEMKVAKVDQRSHDFATTIDIEKKESLIIEGLMY